MKIIEMTKGRDGIYRQGKAQPKQATFKKRSPRYVTNQAELLQRLQETVNDSLEEIGLEAIEKLTRGFLR